MRHDFTIGPGHGGRHGARRPRRGFTLVELIIVVSIIAILAALVVPKFSNAGDTARSVNAASQLSAARKQLSLWRIDHDLWPTLAQMQEGDDDWGVLTGRTDIAGNLDVNGEFGPYLPHAPANPYNNSSLVVAAGAPVAAAGWTYDETNGALRIILPPAIDPDETELTAFDYEQP